MFNAWGRFEIVYYIHILIIKCNAIVQTFSIIQIRNEKLWMLSSLYKLYFYRASLMSEIISPTRQQFCLSFILQTWISDCIFYDVSFIKLYHYVHTVVFQRSMWQTSCALCKSKCRLILGKWNFSALVELALSNLYLFFF